MIKTLDGGNWRLNVKNNKFLMKSIPVPVVQPMAPFITAIPLSSDQASAVAQSSTVALAALGALAIALNTVEFVFEAWVAKHDS